MLKLFTLCIKNVKKHKNKFLYGKKNKKNKIIIWCATSGTPCIVSFSTDIQAVFPSFAIFFLKMFLTLPITQQPLPVRLLLLKHHSSRQLCVFSVMTKTFMMQNLQQFSYWPLQFLVRILRKLSIFGHGRRKRTGSRATLDFEIDILLITF